MKIRTFIGLSLLIYLTGCRNSSIFYTPVDQREYQQNVYATYDYNEANDTRSNINVKNYSQDGYKVKNIPREEIQYKNYEPIRFKLGE